MAGDKRTTLKAAGTTTSGSFDINIAPPAIPTSIVAQPQGGPIAFLEEHVTLLSQRASEAAAVAREAVTDAADVTTDLWRVPTRLCSRS